MSSRLVLGASLGSVTWYRIHLKTCSVEPNLKRHLRDVKVFISIRVKCFIFEGAKELWCSKNNYLNRYLFKQNVMIYYLNSTSICCTVKVGEVKDVNIRFTLAIKSKFSCMQWTWIIFSRILWKRDEKQYKYRKIFQID